MRFHEILISKKKFFLSRCQYQNKKALFTDPIFSEGFDISYQEAPCSPNKLQPFMDSRAALAKPMELA